MFEAKLFIWFANEETELCRFANGFELLSDFGDWAFADDWFVLFGSEDVSWVYKFVNGTFRLRVMRATSSCFSVHVWWAIFFACK